MKKIRYLLSQNNIKPSKQARDRIVGAVTQSYEKFYKADSRASISDVLSVKVIAVICSVLVVAALAVGTVWFVKQATDIPVETDEPLDKPNSGGTILNAFSDSYEEFIKVLHEAVAVYTETDSIAKQTTEVVAFSTADCELFSMYNAEGQLDDIGNIIRTHYAFANSCTASDTIDFGIRRTGAYGGGENRVEVIGRAESGTFIYLLVKEFYIFEGNVYIYNDDGTRSAAGLLSGETYSLDTDVLGTATLYKIRLQNSKYVVYDVNTVKLPKSGIKTEQRLTSGGAYNEIVSYTVSGITLYAPYNEGAYDVMPQTTQPDKPEYTFETDANIAWRGALCDAVNDLELEWFIPLYYNEADGTLYGTPLYYKPENGAEYAAYDGMGNYYSCSYYDPSLPYPHFTSDELKRLPVVSLVKDENGKYVLGDIGLDRASILLTNKEYRVLSSHSVYTSYDAFDVLTADGETVINGIVREYLSSYRTAKTNVLTRTRSFKYYSYNLVINSKEYSSNAARELLYDPCTPTVMTFDPILFEKGSLDNAHTCFETTGLVNVGGYAADINGVIRGIYGKNGSIYLFCSVTAVPKIYTVFNSEDVLVYMGDISGLSNVAPVGENPLYTFDEAYVSPLDGQSVYMYDLLGELGISNAVSMSDITVSSAGNTVSVSFVLGATGLTAPQFNAYIQGGIIMGMQTGKYGDRLLAYTNGKPVLLPSSEPKQGGNAEFILSEGAN